MKKKDILPIIMIVLGTIGLIPAIYLILNPESLDLRKKAAAGRTVRVCSSGCDFTDINVAFSVAQDYDTIFLDIDTYDGLGVLSGTSSLKLPDTVKNLTIQGRGKDTTSWKLTSGGGNGHQLHIENLNSVKVTIKDISFKDNSQANSSVHIYGNNQNCEFDFESVNVTGSKAAGIYYDGSNAGTVSNSYFASNEWPGVSIHGQADVTITDSKFENHQHQGVDVNDSANVEITQSEFSGNNIKHDEEDSDGNPNTSGAVNFYGNSSGVIRGNNFHDNIGNHIRIGKGYKGNITDFCVVDISGNILYKAKNGSGVNIYGETTVNIKNNIIQENGFTNKERYALDGISINNKANVSIVNNTIYNNNDAGILMWDTATVLIKNNIISQNQRYGGITGWDFSGSVNISYNDVWHNFYYYDGLEHNYITEGNSTTTVTAGTGDISQDPKFVSSTDLHLQAGSPAIDAGDPDLAYNDPDGSRNDMGAYGGPGSLDTECTTKEECKPPCRDYKRAPYNCQQGQCIVATALECDKECGAQCTNDNDCGSGQTCGLSSCTCSSQSCTPSCSGKTCGDDGCGGSCGTCPQGETCQDGNCVPFEPSNCDSADIMGKGIDDPPDDKVTIYDFSYIAGKFKSNDELADIWGPNGEPDGIVNIYDFSKVCACFTKHT